MTHNRAMPRARSCSLLLAAALTVLVCSCAPKLDWREFHARDGGFTVLLPQKPGQAEHQMATPMGATTMKMYSVRIDETVLAAGYADFAAPLDARALEVMRDALVRSLNGTLAGDKPLAAGGLAGREIAITGALAAPGEGGKAAPVEMRARLYARDKRYYQVVLAGKQGGFAAADADMFFDSFRLN
jgi:hypothetical protein